jgi:hypothetical protein
MDKQTLTEALQEPQVVAGCLVTLYALQEPGEQAHGVTVERNGVGFNALDAAFGTSLAQSAIAGRMSAKQVGAGRRLVHKYAGQICSVVDEPPRHEIEIYTPGTPQVARKIDDDLQEIPL